jgi:hypothetical protein
MNLTVNVGIFTLRERSGGREREKARTMIYSLIMT